MIKKPYYLLSAQASSFLIHPLSQTQKVKTPLVPYHSLCSTRVSYGTSCYFICHQVLPTQSLPRKREDFLGVVSTLRMCLCLHT